MKATPSNNEESGGRGEGPYLTPVQENKIISMAITQRFPITDEHKAEAVATTSRNMKADDGRISNAAVANLARMELQNQKDEHHADGETLHVDGAVDVQAITKELESDPAYVEFQRSRACEGDIDAGAVCQGGLAARPRSLANGEAHGLPRPGANGHSNGQE